MLIPYLSRGVVCLFGPRQVIHQARPSARLPATHVGREFEPSHHDQQPSRVIPLQSVTIWSLIRSWDFPTHDGQPTPRPLSCHCVFGRYCHHRRDRRAASRELGDCAAQAGDSWSQIEAPSALSWLLRWSTWATRPAPKDCTLPLIRFKPFVTPQARVSK